MGENVTRIFIPLKNREDKIVNFKKKKQKKIISLDMTDNNLPE